MIDTSSFRKNLLASVCLLAAAGALAPQTAQAQDEPVEAEEDGGAIIVTAQKREQALSDVSLSVSAVGSEALVNTNTSSI